MELIIAFAAVTIAVWSIVILRRLTFAQALFGILIVGSCLGHDFFHRNVGPFPITLDRVLWGILALQFGFVFIRRRLPSDSPKLADWTLCAFLAWIAVNIGMTNFAYDGMRPVSLFLFFLLMPAGSYVIGRFMRFEERDYRVLYFGAIGFGIYLALTAIAESRGLTAFVFPRYISDPSHAEFLGRGRGPFLNPVANGIVQTTCLMVGLSRWTVAQRRGRVLLAIYTMIMLAGCYSTLTRTVWMGTAFAISMFVLVNLPPQRRIVFVAGMVLCGGLFLGGAWDQIKSFKRDKNVSVEEMEQSAQLRPLLAAVALRMAQHHPFVGHGFGQYRLHAVDYHFGGQPAPWEDGTEPTQMVLPYVQHNVFLSVLVDLGLIGLAIFLAMLAQWSWQAWRVWRNASLPSWQRSCGLVSLTVISSYLINGMFHDVMIVPMANMFLFTIVGVSGHVYQASAAQANQEGRAVSNERLLYLPHWDRPVRDYAAPRKP